MAFLSQIGVLTFGSSCILYLPAKFQTYSPNNILFSKIIPLWFSFSMKTWKHSLTVFKSIGWLLWPKPAKRKRTSHQKYTKNKKRHTFERINPNFFPDPKRLFNVLPLNALNTQIRKRHSHSVRRDFHRAYTLFTTVSSNQLVGMRPLM